MDEFYSECTSKITYNKIMFSKEELILHEFKKRINSGLFTWPNIRVETVLLITLKGQFDITLGEKRWDQAVIDWEKFNCVALTRTKHFILMHNHPYDTNYPIPSKEDLLCDKYIRSLGYRFFLGNYVCTFNKNEILITRFEANDILRRTI